MRAFMHSRPMLSGWKPSTSLCSATLDSTLASADVRRQRQLHKYTVHLWMVVVSPHNRGDAGLACAARQCCLEQPDAHICARLVLQPHVGSRVVAVAHNDDSKAWHNAVCLLKVLHLTGHFSTDLAGYLPAVDHTCS